MGPSLLAFRLRRLATPLRVLVVLIAVLLVFGPSSLTQPRQARAATHLGNTTYSTNTTWTLAGSPYVLDGTVTVAAGATLTIEPGVIVKANGQLRTLNVNGTLLAVGTATQRIVFTSLQDDSVGGDTGGDGATTGAAGQWYRININSTSTSTHFRFVDVRYGGATITDTSAGAITVAGCGNILVEDSTFTDNRSPGVRANSSNACDPGATVRRSTFERNGYGLTTLNGWVKLEDNTLVKTSTDSGLYLSVTGSYDGPVSTVTNSEVSGNGAHGVALYVDGSVSATYWPTGTRNNIYGNADKQLWAAATKRTVDWKHNYWGEGPYFHSNHGACGGSGQNAIGRLAFRSGAGTPPAGPISGGVYGVAADGALQYCYFDSVDISALELSPFKLRSAVGLPLGQTLGEAYAKNTTRIIADPVNSATGGFTHDVGDLSLPGAGVSLDLSRFYNSIDPTIGPLGRGWTHSYNAALIFRPNSDVFARAGDGQQLEFTKNADGSFTAAAGGQATLTSYAWGYELLSNDQLHYRFDTSGRLTSLQDRNNKGLTFAYDGSGRLSTITDAANRQTTLAYNGSNLLSSVTAPGGRSVSYAYTNGQLTAVTDVRGKVWTYTYESKGFLEKEIDPLQHTLVRNVYGSDGRVIEQYDALNNKTSFAWDQATQTTTATDARNNAWKHVYSNNVIQKEVDALGKETLHAHNASLDNTSVTGPDNKTTTMSYDARGNLTQAVAPASLDAQKTFVYDALNNVTSVTDARGKVSTYAYDGIGNNTSVVQDGVTVATYTYNSSGQPLTFTNGRNYTTTYTYDTNGNLESETDHLGNKTTYAYDAAGRMTSRVEPRGNVQGANPNDYTWTYTYNAVGQTLTETTPLGHVTTYAFDDAGNRTSLTDPNNKTTTYTYDANNRLLTETAPDTGVTTHTYDAVGNKLTEKNPLNKTTTHTYDANNRLTSTTTPLGNKTTYFYDVSGNLIKQVEPRGNFQGANPDDYATTFSYDAAGRLLTETSPLGHTTTYTYDKVGNKTSVKDANNHTTSYAYDGLNRLTTVTAPGGADTTYTYDAAGNLLTRTDANNHLTSYVYDAADRLTSMTLPLNRQSTYAYDPAGNRTSMTDANGDATQTAGDGTSSYTYDRSGRLTGIDYSDSTPDVTYTYDGADNRTQMTDGAGTQTYSYDAVNRLTGVTRGTDTFSYLYDLAGNITRRTYPDTTQIDYTHDDDSRMATVTSGGQTTSYTYDAAANVTATTLPVTNGHVEERTYDRDRRLTRIKSVKGADTLVDHTYTLDPVGNPTQVVRSGTAAGTTAYAYDTRDRLTEVCFQTSCPGGSDPFIRWTYDAVGNRLTEARPSGTTTYAYNAADELTSAGAITFSYDANGNQTQKGSVSYGFNLRNELVSVSDGNSTYSYDGDGYRRTAQSGGSQTTYLWDTARSLPELALERTGAGALIRRHIYGKERIAAQRTGSSDYFHYDRLGSVANVTASTGARQWTYAYDPFGETRSETQDNSLAAANPMKFTGEYADADGLYYLRARHYDSILGRFLQIDPAGADPMQPKLGTYVYVANRPTVFVDPSGATFEAPAAARDAVLEASSPAGNVTRAGAKRVLSAPPRNSCMKAQPQCRALGGGGYRPPRPSPVNLLALARNELDSLVQQARSFGKPDIRKGRFIAGIRGTATDAEQTFERMRAAAPASQVSEFSGRATIDLKPGFVTYRPTSSDRTPVIEFNKLPGTQYEYYKFHFNP